MVHLLVFMIIQSILFDLLSLALCILNALDLFHGGSSLLLLSQRLLNFGCHEDVFPALKPLHIDSTVGLLEKTFDI